MFKILFDYPAWFLLLCLICGALISGLLYYNNRLDGFSRALKYVLSTLRFLSVSILAFLLLAPVFERIARHVEEPILIFVQDNSQSIVAAANEAFDPGTYIQERDNFLATMEDRFDVISYNFGEAFMATSRQFGKQSATDNQDSISLFGDRLTNISSVFEGLEATYSNRNVGVVILASDGIFNRGANPLYASANIPFPVYSIALGDTIPKRDVILSHVRNNRITYLGNTFPVEIQVEARQSAGLSSMLRVSQGGQVLFSKPVRFDTDHHLETILVELEARQPGMQRYAVDISAQEGEVSLVNNKQDFYIEVIDGRQKVLLLAHSPHPDAGAIRMALERSDSYEVESFLYKDFDGNTDAYNLIILHQLPATGNNIDGFLDKVKAADIPLLFIVGKQTDAVAFNRLQNGLQVIPLADDMVEVLPAFNASFALFTLDENTINMFSSYPPLYAPFARYETATSLQTMLNQKIGQVTTGQPLMAFSLSGNTRTGVISGEGIWRWRLHSFMREGNHATFDDMFSRIIQYLSLQEDKSLFRVKTAGFLYENESLVIEAELYNRSYELVNEPEVQVNIINEQGVSFPYNLARTSNAYQLAVGSFPPGDYSYQGNTSLGGERFTAEGRFSVSPLNLEGVRTIADHNLMYQIAQASGGQLYYPGYWTDLRNHILEREDLSSVMYSRKSLDELINTRALFFLILLLLTIEWFIRKRTGSY